MPFSASLLLISDEIELPIFMDLQLNSFQPMFKPLAFLTSHRKLICNHWFDLENRFAMINRVDNWGVLRQNTHLNPVGSIVVITHLCKRGYVVVCILYLATESFCLFFPLLCLKYAGYHWTAKREIKYSDIIGSRIRLKCGIGNWWTARKTNKGVLKILNSPYKLQWLNWSYLTLVTSWENEPCWKDNNGRERWRQQVKRKTQPRPSGCKTWAGLLMRRHFGGHQIKESP